MKKLLIMIALVPLLNACNSKLSVLGTSAANAVVKPLNAQQMGMDQEFATHAIHITLPDGYTPTQLNSALAVNGTTVSGTLFEGAKLRLVAKSNCQPDIVISQTVNRDIKFEVARGQARNPGSCY